MEMDFIGTTMYNRFLFCHSLLLLVFIFVSSVFFFLTIMNVYGNELLVHKSKVSLGLGIKQRNWFVFFFSLDFITCERFVMNCLALCFEWRVLFYLFIFWFIFFSRFSFSYLCFMVSFESLWMSDNFFMVSIYLSWIVLVILRLESIFIPLKTVNFDGWNFEENAIFEFKIFAKRNAFKNWRKKHFFFSHDTVFCSLVFFGVICYSLLFTQIVKFILCVQFQDSCFI